MTTDIARLEREIAVERAALLANLELLEDRARALTDWRQHVRKRPLAAVGAAAAGGLALAMLMSRRPRAAASQAPDDADDAARSRSRAHPVVDRIVSALAVAAAERLFDALGVAMPPPDPAVPSPSGGSAADRAPRANGDNGT